MDEKEKKDRERMRWVAKGKKEGIKEVEDAEALELKTKEEAEVKKAEAKKTAPNKEPIDTGAQSRYAAMEAKGGIK